MLHSLVVGLGRAGHDLHLPVLLRARQQRPQLFAASPVVGVDPYRAGPPYGPGGSALHRLPSLTRARDLLDPEHTVVHVCTPPAGRPAVLEQVLDLGFRTLLVEKPLAADPADLRRVTSMLAGAQARVAVVAPWLASTLTDRLLELAGAGVGRLGALRSVAVVQNKPRFRRSLTAHGHPTAFDIELPHALGVLLALAGDGEVVDASVTDLTAGSRARAGLGAARMRLAHRSGVHSTLSTDLTSPVRERRITLRFDHGTAVGHYAASADDEYAQLRVVHHDGGTPGHGPVRDAFPDDSLTRFMVRTYSAFAAGDPLGPELQQHLRTVELLGDAKRLALGVTEPPGPRSPGGGRADAPGASVSAAAVGAASASASPSPASMGASSSQTSSSSSSPVAQASPAASLSPAASPAPPSPGRRAADALRPA